jgi:hypothetical protein
VSCIYSPLSPLSCSIFLATGRKNRGDRTPLEHVHDGFSGICQLAVETILAKTAIASAASYATPYL